RAASPAGRTPACGGAGPGRSALCSDLCHTVLLRDIGRTLCYTGRRHRYRVATGGGLHATLRTPALVSTILSEVRMPEPAPLVPYRGEANERSAAWAQLPDDERRRRAVAAAQQHDAAALWTLTEDRLRLQGRKGPKVSVRTVESYRVCLVP